MKFVFGALILALIILLGMTAPPTVSPTVSPTTTIPDTITLSGVITERATTLPLEGVEVRVLDEPGVLAGAVTSGVNGTFQTVLTNSTAGTYRIIITKDGKSATLYQGLALGTNDIGELSLERGLPGAM